MSFIREHKETDHDFSIWRAALRCWLYGSAIILPLLVLPLTRDAINLPKSLALYVVVIVALLLWILMLLMSKETIVRRTILDTALGVFLAAVFISALFSKTMSLSVIGRTDVFTLNLFFLVGIVLWAWLIVQICDIKRHTETFTQLLLGAGGIAGVLFLLRNTEIANIFFRGAVLQPLSATNSVFATVVAVLGVLGTGLLLIKGRDWMTQLLPGIVALLSLVILFHTNFRVAWVVYLVGMGCLVAMSVLLVRHTTVLRASAAFIFFLLGVTAMLFPMPAAMHASVPVEVSLGASASWNISRSAWLSNVKTFFIGSGPGTFAIDFSRYRTALFNADPLTWTTRFTVPFNTPLALLSEVGLLGSVPFIFIVLLVFGNIANALKRVHQAFRKSPQELAEACGPEYMTPFVLFAAWLASTTAISTSFADAVPWMIWWLLLVLLLISLSRMVTGVTRRKKVAFSISSEYTLAFSFGMILVVFGILVFGTMGYKLYVAERGFTKVVAVRDVTEQAAILTTVLQKRPTYTEYQLGRARLHVERARQLSLAENADVTQVAEELSQAVELVKDITVRRPNAIEAWELLAVIYMNTRAITPEANTWALDAVERAISLEPSNPLFYWRRANIEDYGGDDAAAETSFIKAIELKPDYVIAYTDLSDLYESQNELTKAIAVYQPIMPVVQDNVELLFRLGRLFYNRNDEGDLDRAQQVWDRAAAISPEHSNTLYSLGLLYERRGDTAKAREYFAKVRDLNPDNEDILTKLRSL